MGKRLRISLSNGTECNYCRYPTVRLTIRGAGKRYHGINEYQDFCHCPIPLAAALTIISSLKGLLGEKVMTRLIKEAPDIVDQLAMAMVMEK
jgi:hypothetical protein